MKAYSQDLRERLLRAADAGYPRGEIVQVYGISLATFKRYVKQRRDEGHVRLKAIPGRPPKKRVQGEADVLPQLQAHADATLEHHCAMWEQTHQARVSRWTMSRAIKRLGWTRKKKSIGATERNEEERTTWRENASQLPTEDLVFLDECGSAIFASTAKKRLSRENITLWLYGETLTLEFNNTPLTQFQVFYQPDKKHSKRVDFLERFETQYRSLQASLWEEREIKWLKVLRLPEYQLRHATSPATPIAEQLLLFA